MNDRILGLIELGRLAREDAPDDEIRGLWEGALEAFDDACLENRSPNRRLTAAYDAGRIAALAVVRAADLRVRARNHHELTLAVAGILGGGELEALLQEFQALRLERNQIEYGWQTKATVQAVEQTLGKVRMILEHAAHHLRSQRPAGAAGIRTPS